MFLQNMLTAAEQVAVLYIIVVVGVIADKTGLYTEKVAKSCTDLLFYIATPAMIINSFFTLEYNSQTAKGLFIALGCGFILHFVSAVLPELIFLRCPKDRACIFKYAAAYGNCGYMGPSAACGRRRGRGGSILLLRRHNIVPDIQLHPRRLYNE